MNAVYQKKGVNKQKTNVINKIKGIVLPKGFHLSTRSQESKVLYSRMLKHGIAQNEIKIQVLVQNCKLYFL